MYVRSLSSITIPTGPLSCPGPDPSVPNRDKNCPSGVNI